MKTGVVILILIGTLALFVGTQLTLFVVQPIGAVPEGRTLLMWRTSKLRFIDSADAVCEREMGSVNLLCRGAVLAGIANSKAILARLPYSETLYLVSTGGSQYSR